MILYRNFCF